MWTNTIEENFQVIDILLAEVNSLLLQAWSHWTRKLNQKWKFEEIILRFEIYSEEICASIRFKRTVEIKTYILKSVMGVDSEIS